MTDLDRCKAFFKQHGYIEFFDPRESGLWKRTTGPSWDADVDYRVPMEGKAREMDIKALYSCRNEGCQEEASYYEDDLREHPDGGAVCEFCWDYEETDEYDDDGNEIERPRWRDLPEFVSPETRRIRELEARVAELEEKQRWRDDMENAPHNCSVLLGWRDWRDGSWCMEVGAASTGRRVGDSSSVSRHGSATHWMHRPAAPKETVDGDEL